MRWKALTPLLLFCACSLLNPRSAPGQNTTGSVTGRLTDPTGAVIAGAKVTVRNLGTGEIRTLTTNASGDFTATLLLPGHYSVTAEHSGFKTSIQNDITLEVDQTVRADLHLDVGSATQKVEVAANALTLDTDTPAVAQTINEKQVSELPLNGPSEAEGSAVSLSSAAEAEEENRRSLGFARMTEERVVETDRAVVKGPCSVART